MSDTLTQDRATEATMNDLASSRHAIDEHFRETMEGKLPPEKLDEILASLHGTTAGLYHCAGRFWFYLFYARLGLAIVLPPDPFPYVFDGDAGGPFGLGDLTLTGSLYTDDFPRLVKTTRRFFFSAGPVLTYIFFWDEDGNYLGYLSADSVGAGFGVGMGSGRWVHP